MPTLTLAQNAAADELLGRDPLALLVKVSLSAWGRYSTNKLRTTT